MFFLGLHKTDNAREVMERENSVVQLENNPAQYQAPTEEQLIMHSLTQSAYLRESERLAEKIASQFEGYAKRVNRGVKQAGFWVLWQASMPAVLVELGFVTNRAESKYLGSKTGQNTLAHSIFRAVRDYKAEYEKSITQVISTPSMP